jgi:hypothetical protein
MNTEYKTTTGQIQWSEMALHVESVPDPEPPDGDPAWELVGSTCTEVRNSVSTVLWFWKKVTHDPPVRGRREIGLGGG